MKKYIVVAAVFAVMVLGLGVFSSRENYKMTQYASPLSTDANSGNRVLLAVVKPNRAESAMSNKGLHHKWTEWEIYDEGVVEQKTGQYFMASCARGMTHNYQGHIELPVQEGENIPSAVRDFVYELLAGYFIKENDSLYTVRFECKLQGPKEDSTCNTRRYDYSKGYDKHRLVIIEKRYSNWDGLLSTTPYTCYGYAPIYEVTYEDYSV